MPWPNKRNLFIDLSLEEKKRFYLQELFDEDKYMKKYVMLICLLVSICETIKLYVIQPGKFEEIKYIQQLLVPFLICIGLFFSFVPHLKFFQVKTSKIFNLRASIICIANFCFCSAAFISVRSYLEKTIDNNTPIVWFDSIYSVSKGIHLVILNNLLFPFWQLKMTVPIAYFAGVLFSYLQSDLPNVGLAWAELITSVIYVVCLFATVEYFRWKLFIKKCEVDDWRLIQECILSQVHNAIVVINVEGKVLYSNKTFQTLAKEDSKDFFRKIVKLRKREQKQYCIKPSLSLSQSQREALAESQRNLCDNPRRSRLLQNSFDEEIKDVNELVNLAIQSTHANVLVDGVYFTFDAKFAAEEKDDNEQTIPQSSYEITLSSMGSYNKVVLIFHDTTHHARLVALESNNLYKDKLLASVSHELRTPLNGNLALLEVALGHEETPQSIKEELLLPAYRSGKLLGCLINDILDYSQIKAEKLRMVFKSLSLKKTLIECHQLLEMQARVKGLDFVLDLSDNLPELFVTDHDRVTQIVLNLLSNALKFTLKGKITLRAHQIKQNQIEVSVEDTGIGIKAENISQLFQEFMKVGEENEIRTMNSKGVGLGLTIADKLARRLGPRNNNGICVESVYGKGSCFKLVFESKEQENTKRNCHIDLLSNDSNSISECSMENEQSLIKNINEYVVDSPDYRTSMAKRWILPRFKFDISYQKIQTSDTRRPLQTSSIIRDSLSIPKKGVILIVDDEPFNMLALQSMLRDSDFAIESAFNGKEALDKVLEKEQSGDILKYKLIFMDCQMPIMDGYEATEKLCKLMPKQIEKIPIIGCTAFTAKSQTEDCFKCGMKDVIHKPVSKKKIYEMIKRYIS